MEPPRLRVRENSTSGVSYFPGGLPYRFHVCTSRTEGWGHVIGEAMGCGAIVLTCDAAPMNELVRPSRGLLVRAQAAETLNAAVCHDFDADAMAAAVEAAIALDAASAERLSSAARQWFEDNERAFTRRLGRAVDTLLAGRGTADLG